MTANYELRQRHRVERLLILAKLPFLIIIIIVVVVVIYLLRILQRTMEKAKVVSPIYLRWTALAGLELTPVSWQMISQAAQSRCTVVRPMQNQ